ncbi:hypothetical protein SAY86_000120 [Trapa natans]|uniref:Uncharacterized protein n=1 Tax=Trapa natans TaxID=22666 RepID=A0AAN7RFG5_TRANT|nr:hypothetical protein SAY86_000120 [Trapa natans]
MEIRGITLSIAGEESEGDTGSGFVFPVQKEIFKSFSNSRISNAKPKNGTFWRQRKTYFRNDDTSSSDNDSDIDIEDASNWPRLSLGGQESDEDERGGDRGVNLRRLGGRPSLGSYDKKIKRRVLLQLFEHETNFSPQMEFLRHEFSRKKMAENLGDAEEDYLLTQKR